MSKLKKIIIFIDSYNDVDHILPFIDYVLKNNKANITLRKLRSSNLSGCESHLQYLSDKYKLTPENYDDSFSIAYKIIMRLYWVLRDFSVKAKQHSSLLLFWFFVVHLHNVVLLLTQLEVRRTAKKIDADTIMMDFGKELTFVGTAIISHFHNKPTSVIGYLHGFSIYTNLDPLQKDKSELGWVKRFISALVKPKRKRTYCDRYVVGADQKHTYFSTSMMSHYDKKYLDRVHEVGIPRFTSEWISEYKNNVLNLQGFTYGNSNRLNVVLFMSHPQYNVNVELLVSTIRQLSLCKNINFVYKPHTRNGLDRITPKELNGYDACDISSLELSEWADVGIAYGTSVAFQLLQDNVPLVMPKYIHLNSTIFEENNACIVVDSVNELTDVFNNPISDIYDMVNHERVNFLIKHYVYGDCDYNHMMDKFYCSSVDA